eukprot:sb/3468595/
MCQRTSYAKHFLKWLQSLYQKALNMSPDILRSNPNPNPSPNPNPTFALTLKIVCQHSRNTQILTLASTHHEKQREEDDCADVSVLCCVGTRRMWERNTSHSKSGFAITKNPVQILTRTLAKCAALIHENNKDKSNKTENNKLPTHLHTLNLPLSAHLSRKSTSSILTRTTLLLVPRSATSVDLSKLKRKSPGAIIIWVPCSDFTGARYQKIGDERRRSRSLSGIYATVLLHKTLYRHKAVKLSFTLLELPVEVC